MLKNEISQALKPHTCNPSYLEGRDQEDHGSKPAQATPYLKKLFTKKGWWNGSRCTP
jgi:hypothetical protein